MSLPLIERLKAHRTLSAAPAEQLEWLATVGVLRTLEPGDILTPSTGPVKGLYVVLDGHLLIRVDRGAGPRIVMEWHAGDVTGVLPYSRIKAPPGDVVAEERTDILAVAPELLPRMIHECHELTAMLVHVMLDRARVFKSSELIDEKIASLGRLAAGLAHELNNPASAVARSAKTLVTQLGALDEAAQRFCALSLSDAQSQAIASVREARTASALSLSTLELSDRQDALDEWLARHEVESVDSGPLVRAGFDTATLDTLGALVGDEKIEGVLAHESAVLAVGELAAEIEKAASRIHSLVAAVKGFTFVNQQTTPMPIGIAQSLADTVTVLRSKARTKSVDIELRMPDTLPTVDGYGGELNQVWANLLDNAIDATPGGHVRLEAVAADGKIVVRVIDDGAGMTEDVAKRVFDPFFTTKDVGQGTGLGLDIARRIVQRHRGAIDLSTGPGGTEFRVTLPTSAAAT